MIEKYIQLIYQGLDTLGDWNIAALCILFCVLTLQEFGVPFPLILQGVRFYIGYEISQGAIETILLVLIFIIGRQCGSGILYWMSRGSSNAISRLYPKRLIRLRNEMESIKEKLQTKSFLAIGAVIVGRFTPGILVPTSIASGSVRLRYVYFALGVLISSVIFDTTFITLAALFGREVSREGLNILSWLILGCFISLTCILWIVQLIKKRQRHHKLE